MSVLQTRLDEAISQSDAGWVRRRKVNGRLQSWRLPINGKETIDVCIWPYNSGYVITTTDPDSTFYRRVVDVRTAIEVAESIAAGASD